MAKALSLKQQALIREFLVDRNKSQAAIRAGYKPESVAHNIGQIYKPAIMQAIQEQEKEITRKIGVKAESVLRELGIIAGLIEPLEGDNKCNNVSTGDKLRALELCGKSLAMFTEKTINETTTVDSSITAEQRQALADLAANYTRLASVRINK